jgi:hypothetical protein
MPLYLVRWPALSASLILAEDEAELMNLLDEVGDPGGCTWEEYQGPLWVDFELPADVLVSHPSDEEDPPPPPPEGTRASRRKYRTSELELDGLEALAELPDLTLVPTFPAGSETVLDMHEAIRGQVFPHIHALAEKAAERKQPERPLSLRALRKAVQDDLQPYIDWLHRQDELDARTDPEAMLLKMLGVTTLTPALLEGLKQALAAELTNAPLEPPPEPTPVLPSRKAQGPTAATSVFQTPPPTGRKRRGE